MCSSRRNIMPSSTFEDWDYDNQNQRPSTLICILEDGTVRKYDAMASSESYYSKDLFTCIGRGWLINFHNPELRQEDIKYFFVRKVQIPAMEKFDAL